MPNIASPPIVTSVIDLDPTRESRRDPFYLAKAWVIWLQNSLIPRVQQAISLVKSVTLPTALIPGTAAVPTTAILTLTTGGVYRLSYIIRIKQAATVSSAVGVTLGWSRSGIALTSPGSVVNGNTTSSVESRSIVVRADALTDLTYAVSYASTGATPAIFEIDVTAEQLL